MTPQRLIQIRAMAATAFDENENAKTIITELLEHISELERCLVHKAAAAAAETWRQQ